MKKKRMSHEERAAWEAKHEDLARRLERMIDRYRRINAERRAGGVE
jgi:hypothetical protein